MPISILDEQKRSRELGRIRMGRVVPMGKGGKVRPEKLSTFRVTSPARELMDKVAALYGGTVQQWSPQGGGPAQWEVITDANRLPVYLPPRPVSQWYEHWLGGGCARRCDGLTEKLSGGSCLCSSDPAERDCKPTTRLSVILRQVEGIGVFRLETHGFYSAIELPGVAEFLAYAGENIEAHLGMEERVVKRNGETRRFMVPILEVEGITPEQLVAGLGGTALALEGPVTDYSRGPGELPAGPVRMDPDSFLTAIAATQTIEDLRALWADAKEAGALSSVGLETALRARAEQLTPAPAEFDSDDANVWWAQILGEVPKEWTTEQVETDFWKVTGVDAGAASVADMRLYREQL